MSLLLVLGTACSAFLPKVLVATLKKACLYAQGSVEAVIRSMLTRRMLICVVTGALLGVVCIIGSQVRSGFEMDAAYLFSFWFNRLLMGVVIGLAWSNLIHTGRSRCYDRSETST